VNQILNEINNKYISCGHLEINSTRITIECFNFKKESCHPSANLFDWDVSFAFVSISDVQVPVPHLHPNQKS